MGVARCENTEEAEALWKRLRLDLMSVRRFRAEREGDPVVPRTIAREVSLAARRLNRALRKLRTAEIGDDDRLTLAKVLRRSDRLIQRQLRTMAEAQQSR